MTEYSDSYANLATALGTAGDKSSSEVFIARPDLPSSLLSDMYEQDDMFARIVDRLPDDATRAGFVIVGDFDATETEAEMEDLNVLGHTADAWRWARLYGGALLVMVVNDGLKMDQPLDLQNATKLSALQVIESPFVVPSAPDPGLGARAFRNPSHYDLQLPFGSDRARRIHRTRVIRFEGMRVPPTRVTQRGGWPPSVLERVYTAVMRLGSAMGYSHNIMHDLSLLVLKIKGLREMLVGDEKSKQDARAIVESIRWNADNLHTIALDDSDDLVELSRSVAGLCDLVDKFVDGLVRSTDMPRTVVLGEQPGGLNANADSEISSWYDFVSSQQELFLTPPLTRLLDVMFRIRENNGLEVPETFTLDYNPLSQPTQLQKSETLKVLAEAINALIDGGLMSPDEGREMLITSGMIPGLEGPIDGGES